MTSLARFSPNSYTGDNIRRLANAGWINVWDFRTAKLSGVMCDGTDDYPAWAAARDSIPVGQEGTLYAPRGAYRLDTSVTDNGRFCRSYIEAGSTFSGAGIVFTSIRYFDNVIKTVEYTRGTPPAANDVLAHYRVVQNTSASTQGYGVRMDYLHSGTPTTGFDIADSVIARWEGMNGGQGLCRWDVYETPNSNTWIGGFVHTEMNPVNRGPDMGWANKPGALSRWVGGDRFVPESVDFSGQGGTGRHVTFAFSMARSSTNNADGVRVRTYTGYMIEPDAIAPGGYGAYWNGSTSVTSTEWAIAMLGGQDTWQYGVKLNKATFSTNYGLVLGSTQAVAWADSSDVVLATISTGTGSPESVVTAKVGSLFLRLDGGVSTTLYVKTSGTGNTGWTAK